MRYKAKLYPSSRYFQKYVARHYMQINPGDSQLLVVRSQISSLILDLSFGHNLCFKYPNGSCKPTSTFQKLSNGVRKSSIQWVLTPTITLWKFRSPLGLEFPKWELTWECEGSFLHTLLHSQKHEMWLSSFTLGLHLCKSLPWSRAQG
jgi:hypothetical protein